MTIDKLSEAIGMLDEDIIAAAESSRTQVKRSKKPLWIGVCSTAACAALITAIALTDPASYLTGEDIVGPENSSAPSATSTTAVVTEDDNAEQTMDGGIVVTGDAADDTCDVDVDTTVSIPDTATSDAPVQPVETGDAPVFEIATGDAPFVEADTEEVEDAPILITEEAYLPESYYPAESAKMLFSAGYPDVPKHPELYEFEEYATCEPSLATNDAPDDTFEVEVEEYGEPENRQEADEMWYANRQAMKLPKGTADDLKEFFTRSMQGYLTSSAGENTVYSPLNMYMAMVMLSQTAGGESREQILSALDSDNVNDLLTQARLIWNSSYKNDGVSRSVLANSLWLRNDLHYNSYTLNDLAQCLHSSSFVGEMGSTEYNAMLREWLNTQTGGQLEDSVSGEALYEDTVMAILSTIDFSSQWSRRDTFLEEATKADVFRGANGDVVVDFMNKVDPMTCYFGDSFTAIYLSGEDYKMWLVLPDEGTTPEQVAAGSEVYELVLGDPRQFDSRDLDVTLSLPKFDISSDIDLRQGMMNLGVTDVFSAEAADFSSLTTDTGSYLNKAEQAVRVAIDENGVKAASYTLMENLPTGIPMDREDIELIFDRPFMFMIENDDGLPMFSGIVNELQPSAEQSEAIISVDVSLCRYDDAELREDSSTGGPQSYEELQDYLSVYSDRMNFVQYEIIWQYSPDEAYALTGNEIFLYSSTLYKARLTRDLINGEAKDIEFLLVSAGTAESQIAGLPLLSVGECYASMLPNFSTETTNVAFPELTFAIYSKGGTDYAYHLRFDKIRFIAENGADIDMGVTENERYVVTSTSNNPVNYVKKLRLSELADLLRRDWTKRGYQFMLVQAAGEYVQKTSDEVIPIE